MPDIRKLFDTIYESAPFQKIQAADYLPLIENEIQEAKREIDLITSNTESPTFKNTIEALEFSGKYLDRMTSMFFNLNSAETNDEIQKLAQKISPMLSEFGNDIRLNQKLFQRVEAVYLQQKELDLNAEQTTLLENRYKSFARNGAALSEDKNKLREIDKKLSSLSLKFGENVLAETNAFELHLTDEKDISGIPEGALEAAKTLPKAKTKKDGYST